MIKTILTYRTNFLPILETLSQKLRFLAKFGQNENFSPKRALHAEIRKYPWRGFRGQLRNGRLHGRMDKGDIIEPVDFAGQYKVQWILKMTKMKRH